MSTVEYSDGTKIEFSGNPTQQDVEEAYNKVKGINVQSNNIPSTSNNNYVKDLINKPMAGLNDLTNKISPVFNGEPTFKANLNTSNPIGNIAKTIGNIPSSTANLAKNLIAPVNPLDTNSPVNIGSNIVQSASALKDIFQQQGAVKGTKSILGGFADTYLKLGEVIYGGLDKAYNALLDNPTKATQDVATAIAKVGIEDPTFIPSLLYGGGETAGAKENLISKISKVITRETDTSLPNIAKETSTIVGNIKSGAVSKLENRYVSQTIDDWNRVGGDYVKTDKLLTQEESRLKNPNSPKSLKDSPTFLSEQGISPKSLVGENGKFDTTDVARTLTTDAVKPYEEILTKQLKVVQQGQPLTNISELRQPIIDSLNSTKGITPDVQENLISIAKNKLSALERKYPKGIPLDQLNVEKGNFWKATKFDMTKPLDPQVNYQIGTAIKDLIETKAGDANVKELNGVLANYYKAGKFLSGLEGKVPKLTVGQKITRGITKTVATVAGSKMFGIEGGIGGFLLSKSVSHLMENSSNPLKAFILNNLKEVNPKAYDEAIKWLGEQEAQRLSRLALPSPNMTAKGNPIPRVITPTAPTTFEPPAKVINNPR